jgi:peroxiredoxin
MTALHVTTPATVTVDAAAPPFTLSNQNGHPVVLADELAHGPMVALVFYRGYW